MICFEISVNGRKVHTIGLPEGLLATYVSYVKHPGSSAKEEGPDIVARGQTPYDEKLLWGGFGRLRVGDAVTIRVVESDSPDAPTSRERIAKKDA